METGYEIKLVQDEKKLSEIQELRILSWESSEKSHFMQDEIFRALMKDDRSTDCIFYVEEAGKVIATGRIRILNDISDLDSKYSNFSIPHKRPFGLCERLAVHPDYRGIGLAKALDKFILDFAPKNGMSFLLTEAVSPRDSKIIKFGWKKLGVIDVKYFSNPENAFQISSLMYNYEKETK